MKELVSSVNQSQAQFVRSQSLLQSPLIRLCRKIIDVATQVIFVIASILLAINAGRWTSSFYSGTDPMAHIVAYGIGVAAVVFTMIDIIVGRRNEN